jgi:dCTP deaminase
MHKNKRCLIHSWWQVRDGKISFGLSSYVYDIRVADSSRSLPYLTTVLDPKKFEVHSMVISKECVYIPPNSYALSRTVENFQIPRGVMTICVGKSTNARCGIIVNVTPSSRIGGYATLEISKTTPFASQYLCQ